jgi:hypothetical protein
MWCAQYGCTGQSQANAAQLDGDPASGHCHQFQVADLDLEVVRLIVAATLAQHIYTKKGGRVMSASDFVLPADAKAKSPWLNNRKWDLFFISLSVILVAAPYSIYLGFA